MTDPAAAYKVLDESTWDEAQKEWTHAPCGSVLMGARVHHSVHNGVGPCGGFGEVQVQTVPYCPTCHEKPSTTGRPLTGDETEWPRVELKPRAGLAGHRD